MTPWGSTDLVRRDGTSTVRYGREEGEMDSEEEAAELMCALAGHHEPKLTYLKRNWTLTRTSCQACGAILQMVQTGERSWAFVWIPRRKQKS